MSSEEAAPPAEGVDNRTLRGASVVGGLAIGRARKSLHDSLGATPVRVPLDAVERELNRFHAALSESKEELRSLKEHLRGEVDEHTARILDVHAALLVDSAFLADVENLVMNEQLALEGAVAKVVSDFDRIFKLVGDASLRERALDLRDVGLRVLRRLRPERDGAEGEGLDEPAILVARELSIVDMFGARNQQVAGIVAEMGSPRSHAAQIARSMRIPTIVGVSNLLDEVEDGDLLLLDASEGVLRVRPDAQLVEQYGAMAGSGSREAARPIRRSRRAPRTRDGAVLEWSAACGSLPEVAEAIESGFDRVGLYRSELVHFVEDDDAFPHRREEPHRIGRRRANDLRQVTVEEGRGPKRAREGGLAHAPNARQPTDRRTLPGPIEAIGPKRAGLHIRSHGSERSGLRPNVKRFLRLDGRGVKTACVWTVLGEPRSRARRAAAQNTGVRNVNAPRHISSRVSSPRVTSMGLARRWSWSARTSFGLPIVLS